MVWRTCWLILKLLLIVRPTTTATADDFPSCQLRIWASDNGKWSVGDTGRVFCKCDNDTDGTEAKDLSLQLHRSILNTTFIDNGTTVQYELPSATETVQNEYECWWDGEPIAHVLVTVFPVLNVTDLSCRFDSDDKLNCSFSRAEGIEFRHKTHYQLSVSSGGTSDCVPEPHNPQRMECMLYANKFLTNTFTLNMTIGQNGDGRTQTQQIVMPRSSMYVPEWPTNEADQKTINDNQTCLTWSNAQELNNEDLEWVVELQPHSPGIDPVIHTLPAPDQTDYVMYTICFPHPPQGHQNFTARVKMHIDEENSLWSEYYYPEHPVTTADTVPARPPQFLPDGFSYDRDNKELTVLWYQLEKVDHNGLNLTYTAYLEGTKEAEASHGYSSSATLKNWDIEKPANVTLRSRNNMGVSMNSSWLWVPAINDVADRQATNFKYHPQNYTLTWTKPRHDGELIGYTIYLCDASKQVGQFCNVGIPIERIWLPDGKRTSYTFNDSMIKMDMALAPTYSDRVSGGMSLRLLAVENKERNEFTFQVARIVEGIGALLVLGLVVLSVKKLNEMAAIEVDMPPIFDHVKGSEQKAPEESPPQWGLPSNINPYYSNDIPLVSIELQTFHGGNEGEEDEEEEVVTEAKPEPSSYVRMESMNRPSLPQINLNSDGYVLPSTSRLIPNENGHVAPPQPQVIPNDNGYVMAPQPRLISNNNVNGYVIPPPPRLFPDSDGYINPPPPRC